MKRLLLAAFAVLALLAAGPAWAGSESREYTVKKGDTLWGISHSTWGTGKLWQKIAEANNIKDPRKLVAGKVIRIPEIVETIKITNHNTSPYGARAVKGDPRILQAIDQTYYSVEVKAALKKVVSEMNPTPYVLTKGEKAECVSDREGVYCSLAGYEFAWPKIGALRADIWSTEIGNRKYEVFVIEICGNFASRQFEVPGIEIETPPITPVPEITPEPIQPPTGEEKVPPKKEILIPLLPSMPLKYKIGEYKPITCLDYELNARQGFWWGDRAHGEFSYAEGGIWDTCWNWGRMVGIYGSRDSGHVDESDYSWHSRGIGPQIGLRYLDFYKNSDNTVGFHGYTGKLRFMYAKMSGKNPESVYRMSQEDILAGLYLEYVRHISKKTVVALTFEGWISLWSKMETTMAGDHISDRAWLQAGGYVQQRLSKNWSNRTGLHGFYHVWDQEPGIGVFSEMRYFNTFLLGASANFGFENGLNYGPYAGVEVGNYAREKRDRKIEDSVWAIDENGNRLDPEEQIWDVNAIASCEECAPAPKEEVQETFPQGVNRDAGSANEVLDKIAEPVNVQSQANDDLDRRIGSMAWPYDK